MPAKKRSDVDANFRPDMHGRLQTCGHDILAAGVLVDGDRGACGTFVECNRGSAYYWGRALYLFQVCEVGCRGLQNQLKRLRRRLFPAAYSPLAPARLTAPLRPSPATMAVYERQLKLR